jgi:methionyl-tRNA synthetase
MEKAGKGPSSSGRSSSKGRAQTFYVTTPIYYVNDIPHIGHAYTTIAGDILARYNRQRGKNVFFLTGTDEHGLKVEKAAAERGFSSKEHADRMVLNFKDLWLKLNISNNAFIRTTDSAHIKIVRELLQKLWDKGLIEKRSYSGWYCVPDERFWTEKDLIEGNCPECGRPVERVEEANYFFLMSRYGESLVRHIEENPDYILPETRRNEVLGFLRSRPLGDLCISRPQKRLAWGIPLPFDEEFVTYVWFDALVNYYSATKYLAPKDIDFWPAQAHLIGKDILTTHAVYWTTMLMALELPLPEHIFAHGWWTVEGKKMSKSLGNVVDPGLMAQKYGVDAFRYFLFREIPFGLDGDFSEAALIAKINTDLANDLGNLSSRTAAMIKRYFGGSIPTAQAEPEMQSLAAAILPKIEEALGKFHFQKALEDIWQLVSYMNKYIDSNAPWALAKDPSKGERLAQVLYSGAECLRYLALYLYPFLPSSMEKLWRDLGYEKHITDFTLEDAVKRPLASGTKLGEMKALFPRIEEKKEEKTPVKGEKIKEKKVEEQAQESVPSGGLLSIEDFARLELKTGKVMEAEAVKGSNKLIRLQVDLGEPERRQIVAGIGKQYTAEELVGKTVIVVANLKPAKLMGVESRGMLLAATAPDGTLSVIVPEKEIPPGAKVK